MKKATRRLGLLLIVLPLFFLLVVQPRLSLKVGAGSEIGAQLADSLRLFLKAPAYAVLDQLEPYRQNQTAGLVTFEVLKQLQAQGWIAGGYVEVSTMELMDPVDALVQRDAALAFGPMAVSTPTGIKLPSPEYLDEFIAQVQKTANEGNTPQDTFYMQNLDDASLSWILRPYQTADDTTVKLIGLAFSVRQVMDPLSQNRLENQFIVTANWQTHQNDFALELLNSANESAYVIGNKAGKVPLQELKLDHTDLSFTGWSIQVWGKKSSSVLAWVISALVMVVGIVLVVRK